jgi:hypothetical protein
MQVQLASERSREIPWTMETPFASHVRAVGFIAKPEAAAELAQCLEGPLMTLLREMPGFRGAVILHSHNEWRNVTVLTFWRTEDQSMRTGWEDTTRVSDLIYPLVDVRTRVQTFQGTFAQACCENCEQTELVMSSF